MSIFEKEFKKKRKPSVNKGFNKRNGGRVKLPAALHFLGKNNREGNRSGSK
jgi:hypothetical protein